MNNLQYIIYVAPKGRKAFQIDITARTSREEMKLIAKDMIAMYGAEQVSVNLITPTNIDDGL